MSEFSGTYEQLLNAAKEMLRREERNTQSSILKALIEEVEAQAALIAELTEALRPFCFFDADHPKTDTTQRAWDIRYTDRFRDWIGFDDIEAARGALARAEEAQK